MSSRVLRSTVCSCVSENLKIYLANKGTIDKDNIYSMFIEEVEKTLIKELLDKNYNLTQISNLLGISRITLRSKMQKFNLKLK